MWFFNCELILHNNYINKLYLFLVIIIIVITSFLFFRDSRPSKKYFVDDAEHY